MWIALVVLGGLLAIAGLLVKAAKYYSSGAAMVDAILDQEVHDQEQPDRDGEPSYRWTA